jgi:septum formation inhibitor-activating ATPase MinD
MIEADTRIVVTTSEISHFQDDMKKWVVQVGSVFGITPSSIDVVVNRIEKQVRFQQIQVKDIQKETQMNVLGKVHHDKALLPQVNRGNLIDAYANSQSLQEDITNLIHQLMDRYRLPKNIQTHKKIRGFKLW